MGLFSWLDSFCHSASDEIGAATGAVYGAGTLVATGGNVAAAAVVDKTISDFVESHWSDVCRLPANIDSAVSGGGSGSDGGSPSFYPDGGAT